MPPAVTAAFVAVLGTWTLAPPDEATFSAQEVRLEYAEGNLPALEKRVYSKLQTFDASSVARISLDTEVPGPSRWANTWIRAAPQVLSIDGLSNGGGPRRHHLAFLGTDGEGPSVERCPDTLTLSANDPPGLKLQFAGDRCDLDIWLDLDLEQPARVRYDRQTYALDAGVWQVVATAGMSSRISWTAQLDDRELVLQKQSPRLLSAIVHERIEIARGRFGHCECQKGDRMLIPHATLKTLRWSGDHLSVSLSGLRDADWSCGSQDADPHELAESHCSRGVLAITRRFFERFK